MKTLKKQVTFDNGIVDDSLSENVGILDRSARNIINMFSTIFNTLKTRFGTIFNQYIFMPMNYIENPFIHSVIGDDIDYYSGAEQFISYDILRDSDILFYFETINGNIRRFVVENAKLSKNVKFSISYTTEIITKPNHYKVILIDVINGGYGYLTTPSVVFAITNKQAEEILPTATAEIDENGSITNINITNEGYFLDPGRLSILVAPNKRPPELRSFQITGMSVVGGTLLLKKEKYIEDDPGRWIWYTEEQHNYNSVSISFTYNKVRWQYDDSSPEVEYSDGIIGASPVVSFGPNYVVESIEGGKQTRTTYKDIIITFNANNKYWHFKRYNEDDTFYYDGANRVSASVSVGGATKNVSITITDHPDSIPQQIEYESGGAVFSTEQIIEQQYERLLSIEVGGGGLGNVNPDALQFMLEEQRPEEIVPQVRVNYNEIGVAVSLDILECGKFINPINLKYTIAEPPLASMLVRCYGKINGVWEIINNSDFVIDEVERDILVQFPEGEAYNEVRLNKQSPSYLPNSLTLKGFGFDTNKPVLEMLITSNGTKIATDEEGQKILNSNQVFISINLNNRYGDYFRFFYATAPDVLSISNLRIGKTVLPTFSFHIKYLNERWDKKVWYSTTHYGRSHKIKTTIYFDDFKVIDKGQNLPPNRTFYMVKQYNPTGKMPRDNFLNAKFRFTTDNTGRVNYTNIDNNGLVWAEDSWKDHSKPDNYFWDNPTGAFSMHIPFNEFDTNANIDLALYGRFSDTDDWNYIQQTNLNANNGGEEDRNNINISFDTLRRNPITSPSFTNIDYDNRETGYKDFKIVRADNRYYDFTYLSIHGNITTTIAENDVNIDEVKLIPFVYKEQNYTILISTGMLLFFDQYNNKIQNSARPEIRREYLKQLKYSQSGNNLIITHAKFQPIHLKFLNGSFQVKTFEIQNVNYVSFTNEVILANYSAQKFSYTIADNTFTADTPFFNESHVGQYIDGGKKYKGRVKITDIQSNTKATVLEVLPFSTSIQNITLSANGLKIVGGYEAVWSEVRGWPSCCLFYQNRLWFNGSEEKQNMLFASRLDVYNDFNLGKNNNTDGIALSISSSDFEKIIELVGNKGVQIFCENTEFIIDDQNLTANNVFIRRVSNIGINKLIKPIVVIGNTFFVDKNNKSLNAFNIGGNISTSGGDLQNISVLNATKFVKNIVDNPIAIAFDYNNVNGDGNFIYLLNQNGDIIVGNINSEQLTSWTIFKMKDGTIKDFLLKKDHLEIYIIRNDNRLSIEIFNEQSIVDKQQIATMFDDGIPADEGGRLFCYVDEKLKGNTLKFFDEATNFNRDGYVDDTAIVYFNKLNDNEPPLNVKYGFVIMQEIETNFENIEGLTNNIQKRIASCEVNLSEKSAVYAISINGKDGNVTNLKHSKVIKSYATTSFEREVNLNIEIEGNVELKSIIKTINVGGTV